MFKAGGSSGSGSGGGHGSSGGGDDNNNRKRAGGPLPKSATDPNKKAKGKTTTSSSPVLHRSPSAPSSSSSTHGIATPSSYPSHGLSGGGGSSSLFSPSAFSAPSKHASPGGTGNGSTLSPILAASSSSGSSASTSSHTSAFSSLPSTSPLSPPVTTHISPSATSASLSSMPGANPLPPVVSSSPSSTSSTSSRRMSGRLNSKAKDEEEKFNKVAAALGLTSTGTAKDVTSHFLKPLVPGNDGRLYTAPDVRRGINADIQSTQKTFPNLESSNLPPQARALRTEAQKQGKSSHRLSTRSAADNFSSGSDHTYTENTGASHAGTRTASDTPRPKSPKPESTGTALKPEIRSENAHQNPFQFTGQPGNTVNVPTQANQVADTNIERFVAQGGSGGFVYRHDTPTHSTLWAARPVGRSGSWTTQNVSYQRRLASSSSSSSASSSSSSTASTTSTTSTTTTTASTPPGTHPSPGKGGK
jgi:hypothetical protein